MRNDYTSAPPKSVTVSKISSKNVLARRFFANRFINLMRLVWRATTLEAINYYAPSPDDRTDYEGLLGFNTGAGYTGTTCTFELNNDTHTVTFNLETNSVITTFEDQLPLNDLYTQTMTVTNQWDAANSADLAMAFT